MAGTTKDKTDETDKVEQVEVVRYVGSADAREIDALSFKRADVEDQKKVVWNSDNGHEVSAADLSPSALEYLRSQPDFTVVKPSA